MLPLIVLAVIVVALGGALLYMATSADDDQAGPPVEVQTLIDDFVVAMETADYEAMQALVTDRFRRPFYEGDPDGVAYRDVWNIEAFTFLETETTRFDIESVGDPIARGDGPWFVSVAQDWVDTSNGDWFEVIYTFAVVDDDGTLKIDDAYWVGRAVPAGFAG